MKTFHRILPAAALAALAAILPAAAETAAPEAAIPAESSVGRASVRELMDGYLAEKGWTEGWNARADGSGFFVSCGTGVIQADPSARTYVDSRVNAFDKAMLDAEAKMAEFLATRIRTSMVSEYAEGAFAGNDAAESDETSVVSKLRRLLHAKLDKALRDEGVDPGMADAAARERAAAKSIATEAFARTIRSCARAAVCGMQAACTFEGIPASGKGEIGVVSVWSPKLQAMAHSLQTGAALPAGVAKRPISQQIPQDAKTLVSTFGIQQKLDENGRLVLVAFGQAGAVSDSAMAAGAAEEKARQRAIAAIREFAGRTVAVASDMASVETVEEFENAAEEYTDASAFRRRAAAVADEMKIAGIATVKRWNAVHPVSGGKVYGVVATWSPASAARAAAARRAMETAPGARPVAVPSPVPAPVRRGDSMSGRGASADDDAM